MIATSSIPRYRAGFCHIGEAASPLATSLLARQKQAMLSWAAHTSPISTRNAFPIRRSLQFHRLNREFQRMSLSAHRMSRIISLLACTLAFFLCGESSQFAQGQTEVPARTGYVNDFAGVVDEKTKVQLTNLLENLK